jgi:hypothetical protein
MARQRVTPGRASAAAILPATPASVKLLGPVIPVGFTKSARLPGF